MIRIKGWPRSTQYSSLLRYIQIYILFTLGLFLFGPIEWQNQNNFILITFICLYLITFSVGYHRGIRVRMKKSQHISLSEKKFLKILRVLIWIGIIYSILFIFRYGKTYSVSAIISNTINNLTNPAANYEATQEGALQGQLLGGGILSLVVTFSGPITISAIILPIINFEKLSLKYKILSVSGIILQFAGKTVVGTNEGLFDIGIFIIAAIWIHTKIVRNKRKKNENNKKRLLIYVIIVAIIIALLAFFTNNISQRTGATFMFPTIRPNKFNPDAPILKYVPVFLHTTLAYLTVYLCEGYYGMALALSLDWIPTWGTGFSSFIRNNLQELFNIDLIKFSYQGRAEKFGWGANRNWHTGYTWFANDVSFIGVIFIMFIIGWLLARMYKDSVENKNPFACVIFGIMLMQVFFLSCNNKIFADASTFITFWLFLLLWIYTKRVNQIKSY